MTMRRLPIDQSTKYPFCLNTCAEAAQDFRWRKLGSGWYSTVLNGNLIHMRQNDDGVEYESNSDANLNGLLHSYFRLDDDIDSIYADISSRCKKINQLVKECPSLRIMRQPDPWECMVAYICSAPNSVEGISKSVESIACRIGKPLELNGETRHAFPTPEMVLAEKGRKQLEQLNLGLDRHSKIIAAAALVEVKLNLRHLANTDVSYDDAKRQLRNFCGIDHKVASCICLFTLDKMESFPVDRHIRNALQGCGCSPPAPSSQTAIMKWAHGRFGEYAGYANQLLFKGAWDESQKSRKKAKGSNPHLL